MFIENTVGPKTAKNSNQKYSSAHKDAELVRKELSQATAPMIISNFF